MIHKRPKYFYQSGLGRTAMCGAQPVSTRHMTDDDDAVTCDKCRAHRRRTGKRKKPK